jgi:septal ring factor EnvC (AmiA/AmiB activator)
MSEEQPVKITTEMPDPMRLLAYALAAVVAAGGYIWRGEVSNREKLEATVGKQAEQLADLKTQLLVSGTGYQGTVQRINELADDLKQLRRDLRPVIEAEARTEDRRGRRRDP